MSGNVDIQFRGNKVVVIDTVPEWRITTARTLVKAALDGSFKFEWLHFKKPIKDDHETNPRSLKWNRNNAHDPWPSKSGVREWRNNLRLLREALKLLFRQGEITSYHVDGTGRLRVLFAGQDTPVQIEGTKIPVYPSSRKPISLEEKRAQKAGRAKRVEVDIHDRVTTLENTLDELKRELAQKRLIKYGNDIDVVPPPNVRMKKYDVVLIDPNANQDVAMTEHDYDKSPQAKQTPEDYERYREMFCRVGKWAHFVTIADERAKEVRKVTAQMFSLYSKHLISFRPMRSRIRTDNPLY